MKTATINRVMRRGPVAAVALFILVSLACAQSSPKTSARQASSLRHYDIKVSDLPAPEVLTGPRNQSKVIPRPEGAQLTLPAGFAINVFAEGELQQPRGMVLAPNGDVFVTESMAAGRVTILRDSNGDGTVDE